MANSVWHETEMKSFAIRHKLYALALNELGRNQAGRQ